MGTGEALPVAAASPVELRHLFGQWLSIAYMAFAQVHAPCCRRHRNYLSD